MSLVADVVLLAKWPTSTLHLAQAPQPLLYAVKRHVPHSRQQRARNHAHVKLVLSDKEGRLNDRKIKREGIYFPTLISYYH